MNNPNRTSDLLEGISFCKLESGAECCSLRLRLLPVSLEVEIKPSVASCSLPSAMNLPGDHPFVLSQRSLPALWALGALLVALCPLTQGRHTEDRAGMKPVGFALYCLWLWSSALISDPSRSYIWIPQCEALCVHLSCAESRLALTSLARIVWLLQATVAELDVVIHCKRA